MRGYVTTNVAIMEIHCGNPFGARFVKGYMTNKERIFNTWRRNHLQHSWRGKNLKSLRARTF